MPKFEHHTRDSAPEGASKFFDATEEKFGFTPNLIRVLAESPQAAEAYLVLSELLSRSSLTPVEQQVVLLSVSFENRCNYCMAAHTAVARIVEMPDSVLEALRAGTTLPDARLDALSRFTRAVVRERGWVGDREVERLLSAGYSRATVFDVLIGVAVKTISNYTNHIAETRLDEQFREAAWEAPATAHTA